MSNLLRHVSMFSGNTILGDGSVIMIVDPNALGAVVGQIDTRAEPAHAAAEETKQAEEGRTALLLFRAGSKTLKAVPLSLITRLEEIALGAIEHCNGEDVVQYRGALMPLVHMRDEPAVPESGVQPVLVFTEAGHPAGLVIDEIVDIVEEHLAIELQSDTPGVIGGAIIRDKAVEIVDVSRADFQSALRGRHGRGRSGGEAPARRRQPVLPQHAGAASDGKRIRGHARGFGRGSAGAQGQGRAFRSDRQRHRHARHGRARLGRAHQGRSQKGARSR
jgi:hypothetical protein